MAALCPGGRAGRLGGGHCALCSVDRVVAREGGLLRVWGGGEGGRVAPCMGWWRGREGCSVYGVVAREGAI